jgi:putative transposase
MTVAFIDANRKEFGVEPICRALQVAPSTYYQAKTRPPSPRAVRHTALTAKLVELWKANYSVYGARKLWKALRRAGEDVGRDQIAALMRRAGIRGARRGKMFVRTTRADRDAARPADLVERRFSAAQPNALWVTDLTYVATWAGMAYVCFIVDVFSRRIVGWRVAANMRTDMVLDALEMARWQRGTRLEGLICHSDAGSQIHVDPLHRTPRRDRRPPLHRHRRRFLRQRPGRDRQSTGSTRPN